VWICSADNEDSLEVSLKTLAAKLNVEAYAKENYRMLMKKLDSYEKVLLVLDNAQEISEPLANGKVHLLLTSRNSNLDGRIFKLDKWRESTALSYIREGTERTDEETDLQALVRILSCVPLGLKVARKYINRERDMPIRELLNKLQAQNYINSERNPQAAVMIAECISKAKEHYPPVVKVLWLSALLSSECVPRDIYASIFADVFATADLRECKAESNHYSLIEEDSSGALSMHTLVQQTVLSQVCMSESLPDLMASINKHLKSSDKQQEVLRCTKPTLCFLIGQGFTVDSVCFCMNFLHSAINLEGISQDKTQQLTTIHKWVFAHPLVLLCIDARTIIAYAWNLKVAGKIKPALDLLLSLKPQIEARDSKNSDLYNTLGQLYKANGDVAAAEKHYLKCLELRSDTQSPQHSELAGLYYNLGNLYKIKGDMREAEQCLLKCLAIWEGGLDAKHPNLVKLYFSLGDLYRVQSNSLKAEEYYQRSMEILGELLIPKHPDLLAEILSNTGSTDNIEDKRFSYILRCTDPFEEVRDPEHPNLATIYNNLGILFRAKGNIKEAEKYYLMCLAQREEVLYPKHPKFAGLYYSLGDLYQTKGDLTQAEKYYLKGLEIWEVVLGPKHSDLAKLYYNLGNLYQAKGDMGEAEQYYLKCLEIWEEEPKHPQVATVYRNMRVLGRASGKDEEIYQRFD
jgi:tetratricopeptide (TPR) repeat protein